LQRQDVSLGKKERAPPYELRQHTPFINCRGKLHVWGKKEKAPPYKAETTYNIFLLDATCSFPVFADIPPHKAEVDLSEHKRQKLMLNCRGRLYVREKKERAPPN
jgi:hypothetical protein